MPIENPASKTTLHRIDMLARRIFRSKLKLATVKGKITALRARYQPEIEKLEEQIDKDSQELSNLTSKYRVRLIAPGKKSFATFSAIFRYTGGTTKFKVTQPDQALALARKLGFAKSVTERHVVVTLIDEELMKYLEANPELIPQFDNLVEWPHDKESLSVKPNDGYLTQHSSDQLSDKAISLPPAN